MCKYSLVKSVLLLCLMMLGVDAWADGVVKCTSVNDLEVGAVYYISASDTYSSTASVMGGISDSGNNFRATTFAGNPCELTLGGSAGGWTFSYVDGTTTYYLDPTSTTSSNYLKRNTSVTDYGKFTIEFGNDGNAVIKSPKKSNNILQFYSGGNIYSCYPNSQSKVYLYKKTSTTTPEEVRNYTVSFSVNGTIDQSNEYEENADVNVPSVENVNDMVFVGWVKNATVDATEVPAYETIAKATEDVTYYAVFANVRAGGAGTFTDVMTQEWTGAQDNSYIGWSDKSLVSGAVYKGRTAGSFSSIILRNNSSATDEGIMTTTSGGFVKKVAVVWNSNQTPANSTLNVFGKNDQYTDLKTTANKGTLLGSIVYGTSTELTISGDYKYIALASDSGTLYLTSISIDWAKESVDEYYNFTTQPLSNNTATITLNSACHDEKGRVYSTYSSNKAFRVPENLTVAEVGVENAALVVAEYATGDCVPANTGVMVSAAEGGDYEVELVAEADATIAESKLGESNCLRPSGDDGINSDAMYAANEGCVFYRLTMHNGTQIGYWWGAAEGAAFNLAANKAYLAVPKVVAAKINGLWQDDDATLISVIGREKNQNGSRYNLNGQRVNANAKGIVIVNGKKVVL